jgi:hypothetical protein
MQDCSRTAPYAMIWEFAPHKLPRRDQEALLRTIEAFISKAS